MARGGCLQFVPRGARRYGRADSAMPLTKITMSELSGFRSLVVEPKPGINVLLGANSTGKTHLLKWIYGTLKPFERPLEAGDDASALLRQKLAGIFRPDERRIGRLVWRRAGVTRGEMTLLGDEGKIHYTLNSKDTLLLREATWSAAAPVVFLPSRETLAMYEGFVAAYTSRELSFDETYYDVCVALSAAGLRGRRGDLAARLMEPVKKALGGDVELIGEHFYIRFDGEQRPLLEAHLVAEGLRKIGSLARLIQNGSLLSQSVLLWDEPESSLNPRLITVVAEILGVLAQNGVQIFLATHDYLLARRLSMLSERSSARGEVPVRFFLLHRDGPLEPIQVASGSTLAELPRTPMEDEFLRLYADERASFAHADD